MNVSCLIFWSAILEKCTENGQWPPVILYSVTSVIVVPPYLGHVVSSASDQPLHRTRGGGPRPLDKTQDGWVGGWVDGWMEGKERKGIEGEREGEKGVMD